MESLGGTWRLINFAGSCEGVGSPRFYSCSSRLWVGTSGMDFAKARHMAADVLAPAWAARKAYECSAAGSALRKLLVSIMTICALFLSCPGSIRGNNPSRGTKISGMDSDQLGEKLKRFRARYRHAQCHRNLQNDFEGPRSNRDDGRMWVGCSVDSGVSLAGYPLLSAVQPEYPLGMTATFHKQRLVALTYVSAAHSVEAFLPEIKRKYGQPSNTILDNSGIVSFASWNSRASTLVVETVPIEVVVYRSGFVRITDRAEVYAVAIQISLNDVNAPAN